MFRDFPTFSRAWIFFLRRLSLFDLVSSSLLFSSFPTLPISAYHLSILSEVWLLNFLRQLPLQLQLRYITLHYTTLLALHYTTLRYTAPDYTTAHNTTAHYTTLHYTTLGAPHHITTTTATTLHYSNYTTTTTTTPLHIPTLQLQLQLRYTTLHPAVVVRWPLQPLQPLQKTQLQPLFGPSVASLCHPSFTTANLPYRFPIFETSATALCGTTGII